VAAQLAPRLTALATRDGSHSVTVVLAPESLGRVEVQLTVTGDQVSLAMSAGQDGSRAVLADAVPELRRELAAAGLQLTDAQVSTGGGQQSGSGWTAGQDPRSPGSRWDAVPTGRATADEDTSTSSTTRHTRGGPAPSGVDVRV
jgi:flagellar hook-length control protein FliK